MALTQSASGVHYSPAAGITLQTVKTLTCSGTVTANHVAAPTSAFVTKIDCGEIDATADVSAPTITVATSAQLGAHVPITSINDAPFTVTAANSDHSILSQKGIQTVKAIADQTITFTWAGCTTTKDATVKIYKTPTRLTLIRISWPGGNTGFVSDAVGASSVDGGTPLPVHYRPISDVVGYVNAGYGNPVASNAAGYTIDTAGNIKIWDLAIGLFNNFTGVAGHALNIPDIMLTYYSDDE